MGQGLGEGLREETAYLSEDSIGATDVGTDHGARVEDISRNAVFVLVPVELESRENIAELGIRVESEMDQIKQGGGGHL